MIGHGFDERSTFTCIVETADRDIVELNRTAKCISDEEIECTLPSLSVGVASLRVVESGSRDLSNPLDLSVHPAGRIMGLTPEMGATKGGTRVLVEAAGIEHHGDDLRCSFGGRMSQLNILNSTHGLCISPPNGLEEGRVEFAIVRETATATGRRLVGAVGVTSPPRHFTYRNPPKILSVAPRQGPASGGTIVHIATDGNATEMQVDEL